jgi:hypothetical protein
VGTLNGTVLDPDGFMVPGASLVATNIATGEEHKTTSTSAGAYTLPYVPSGTYKIRVTAPGFRTSEADNVILRVAQTLTVNIALEIGEIGEQVTVSDKPPLLEPQGSRRRTRVDGHVHEVANRGGARGHHIPQ